MKETMTTTTNTPLLEAQQATRSAREAVASLVTARAELETRAAELEAEREGIALASFEGDRTAQKRLASINSESVKHEVECKSLDAAIRSAQTRLLNCEGDERLARDNENAVKALQLVDEFTRTGVGLDDELQSFLSRYERLIELSRSLRSLGALSRPSEEHLKTASRRALAAATMFTLLQFEFLPPGERHNFTHLTASWARFVRDWAIPRRGADDINARLQQELEQAAAD